MPRVGANAVLSTTATFKLSLHPSAVADRGTSLQGARDLLDGMLMRHHDRLGGVLVSYEKPRLVDHADLRIVPMAGYVDVCVKAKVRVFEGEGALAGPGRVAVTAGGATTELEAANVILAPGARPRTVDGLEADGERIWTYKEAMAPGDAPARLLVVGAGAIGIEFASFYRSLGVDVTVVEMLPRVLPQEDAEISDLARKAFERDGIRIVTGARVDGVDRDGAAIGVRIATDAGDTETVEVDRVLVAAGIVANTEGLGLETGAVRLERGRIVVDEWLSTDEP